MKYTLTQHAEKRLRRRKIALEWIIATLEHPARTENDDKDPELAHALRSIPERGLRVLRVVYDGTAEPVHVVTA